MKCIQEGKAHKSFLTILILSSNFSVVSAQELTNERIDTVKELPKVIAVRYGNDLVPDENTAVQIADVILKRRTASVNFDKLKPYLVKSIADDKVWEIKITQEVFVGKFSYWYVRINKNTGEILNIWVER